MSVRPAEVDDLRALGRRRRRAAPTRAMRPSSTSTAAPSRGGAPVPSKRRALVSQSGVAPTGGAARRAGMRAGTRALNQPRCAGAAVGRDIPPPDQLETWRFYATF